MEIDLMNHIMFDQYHVLFNGTKKAFTDLLLKFAEDEPEFKPVKFKVFVKKNGYKMFYIK